MQKYYLRSYMAENYNRAKKEADKIEAEIIETLKAGANFRVEAGAGSGKTYSLNRVIEWLDVNKKKEFDKNKQNVICITFTNAAVDVIKSRIPLDSFIIPSTIHSFAWSAISQYQSTLIDLVKDYKRSEDEQNISITNVQYTLGHRYIENSIQYLNHGDVLNLFVEIMKSKKFRNIFSSKYPIILIDEYQDSYKPIIDSFIQYFISQKKGPQFGFFGDSWQTIYHANNACGKIDHQNIREIKKVSNFRSAPKIVNFLNSIRPDLPQYSAIDDFEGDIKVITCEDYSGHRRTDRAFNGDLPVEELKSRLNNLIIHIKNNKISADETLKTLMITHKVLASQQGYNSLLEVLGDRLKNNEDEILNFFSGTIEPIYKALIDKNTNLLFDALGSNNYPITKKSDKNQWIELKNKLEDVRKQKAIDVINVAIASKIIPIPELIFDIQSKYEKSSNEEYFNGTSIANYLDIEYDQFVVAINFLHPESEFSTEHGVKGEEYDNVIFTISKGWNNYQFDIYAPKIINDDLHKNDAAYVRNRNLFYVCCSRPRRRLFIFISSIINDEFKDFLKLNIGANNIYTYEEYLAS